MIQWQCGFYLSRLSYIPDTKCIPGLVAACSLSLSVLSALPATPDLLVIVADAWCMYSYNTKTFLLLTLLAGLENPTSMQILHNQLRGGFFFFFFFRISGKTYCFLTEPSFLTTSPTS